MSKTAIVYTCAHTKPGVSNERADWLGKLIYDVRPDYVVDLGDASDMYSLNSYDTRYPQAICSKSYEKDISTHLNFQERIRFPFRRAKKKMPDFFGIMGNHEERIVRAINLQPQLEGTRYGISFNHLETKHFYNEYVPYENGGPGIFERDGIQYSHFISSGNFGRAMSGEHHAYNLIRKRLQSVTVGHSHKRNICFRDDANAIGLVAGCFKGADEAWAGQANGDWWSGVVIKRQIENGMYEPEFVSLKTLEKVYGH